METLHTISRVNSNNEELSSTRPPTPLATLNLGEWMEFSLLPGCPGCESTTFSTVVAFPNPFDHDDDTNQQELDCLELEIGAALPSIVDPKILFNLLNNAATDTTERPARPVRHPIDTTTTTERKACNKNAGQNFDGPKRRSPLSMLSSLKHNKKVVIVPFLPRPLISVESMLEQLSEIEKNLYVVEKNLEMLDNFDKVNDVHDDVLKWTKLQETTRKLPKTQLSNEVVGELNDGNEVLTECELRNKKRRFAETMAETTPTTTPPPKKRKKERCAVVGGKRRGRAGGRGKRADKENE